jgi:hypothetical protein
MVIMTGLTETTRELTKVTGLEQMTVAMRMTRIMRGLIIAPGLTEMTEVMMMMLKEERVVGWEVVIVAGRRFEYMVMGPRGVTPGPHH